MGPKLAQRVILELKDKAKTVLSGADSDVNANTVAAVQDLPNTGEAIAALTMLGFSPAPAQKAVVGILRAEPDASVEQVIKLALKML